MSKAILCQATYNEMVAANCTKADIIAEFMNNPNLTMTEKGATTYYYNCKRVANGGAFNIVAGTSVNSRKEVVDNSPDVEDDRPLYTVVTPKDGPNLTLVVESTHSFFHYADAKKMAFHDQIVVLGLPDIDSDFDALTPFTP